MFKLSSHAKKATRAQAFDWVCLLKEGQTLYPEQIDSLLLYFAPAAPARPKTAIQWVAKACNPKDVRSLCQFVYVKDGRALGTDGHRLHDALVDLADGVYCPKTFALIEDGDLSYFDNIARVARKFDEEQEFPFAELEHGVFQADKKKGKPLTYFRVPDGVAVNAAYLNDALAGSEPEFIYHGTRGMPMMRGESDFGNWVVMGLRV